MGGCFLYLRVCDYMLMVHDPKIVITGTPDDNYFEFDDYLILGALDMDQLPRHVTVYIRYYIYRTRPKKLLDAFDHGDGYDEACNTIRDAFEVYKKLDFEEKTRLHKKELDRITAELRREQAWALSIT